MRISVFDDPLPTASNHLSFGGGKQSTAMLSLAIEGKIPRPDTVIFADPMWERDGTYKNIDYWKARAKEAGIPFIQVSAGNIVEDMIMEAKSDKTSILMPMFVNSSRWEDIPGLRKLLIRDVKHAYKKAEKAAKDDGFLFEMPPLHEFMDVAMKQFDEDVESGKIVPHFIEMKTSKLARKCTVEYKIKPIQKWIKEHYNVSKDNPAGSWIGISLDEFTRMVIDPPDSEFRKIYPLVDLRMSTEDCIQHLKSLGHPTPIKSACKGCPFHDNDGWGELTDEELAEIDALEELLNYLIQASEKLRNRPYFANGVHFHRSKEGIGTRPFDKVKVEVDEDQEMLYERDDRCSEAGCFL